MDLGDRRRGLLSRFLSPEAAAVAAAEVGSVPYAASAPRLCYLASSSEMHMKKVTMPTSFPTVAGICSAMKQ